MFMPYSMLHEEDTKDHVYQVSINIKPEIRGPISPLATALGDAIHNLRDALDVAGYSIAVALGKTGARCTAFPFGGSPEEFEKHGLGRCKDLPDEIQNVFRAYKPYKGGNDLLWALNDISVGEKHKMITPVGMFFTLSAAKAGTQIAVDPTWDRTNDKIIFARFAESGESGYNFGISFSVAFDNVPVVGGQPIISVLDRMADMVEHILNTLEAECFRLGYII